ncbi:MAG: hypothetical protein EXS13_13115 [Planctomycetes bacterium]|nr:hypothetical protein [Planctomycetota bacterium]
MTRTPRLAALAAVGAVLLTLLGGPAGRSAPPESCKVFFAGPISGPLAEATRESLAGVRAALAQAERAAFFTAPQWIEQDDGDDPKKADAACEAAKKQKADLIVAAASGATVESYVAKARKLGIALLLVGSAGPGAPSVAVDDAVSWLGTSAVEQAVVIGNFLEVPCHSKQPAFVVEETARGKELAAALERNLKARFKLAAPLFVAPHAAVAPELLAKWKEAGVDRLVLIGEPDLADATASAIAAAGWSVPLFLTDGMVSAAANCLHAPGAADLLKDAFLLDGQPRLFTAIDPALANAWQDDPARRGDAPVPPRMRRAFDHAKTFLRVLSETGRKPKLADVIAALRDVRYDSDENCRPLFDPTLRSARQLWTPWKLGASGPVNDDPRLYYDPDFGPLLRVRPASLYQAEPGSKIVHVWFGDATSKAVRSIEKDLTALGLITRGYDVAFDTWILDELLARTFGKLNKLFLKNEDGSFIPGVSFNISFTNVKPEGLEESKYWRAVIAGDDSAAGGRAWPGEGRCEIYSTFMLRTIFQKDALVPPISEKDRRFLDGKYVWASSTEENLRIKTIRCLIDGYAGSFALTGAHELGHIIGVNHDETDPRSIMNVVEGAGLRETSACWIPEHLGVMERVLGRYGEMGAKGSKGGKPKR